MYNKLLTSPCQALTKKKSPCREQGLGKEKNGKKKADRKNNLSQRTFPKTDRPVQGLSERLS